MAQGKLAQGKLAQGKTTSRAEELSRLVTAAKAKPFWLDRPDAPPARPPVRGDLACDLVVIGGGFTGLCRNLWLRALDAAGLGFDS